MCNTEFIIIYYKYPYPNPNSSFKQNKESTHNVQFFPSQSLGKKNLENRNKNNLNKKQEQSINIFNWRRIPIKLHYT